MYKILPFFLLIFLMPFYAYGANCSLNTAHDGCVSYDGCEYTEPDVFNDIPASCTECQGGDFNSTSQDSFQCTLCGNAFFPNTALDGKEWDSNDTSTGNTECQWKCASGWYKNDADTGCVSCPNSATTPEIYPDTNNIGDCSSCPSNLQLIHANNNKYYCGQCGAGTPTTQGGITTCSCFTGANHINGNTPTQGNIRVECLCSGTFVDGQCVCPLNKYLHQDNNGVYSCESCPDHSTSAQGSTDVNDCQCISNFPNRILDENGKLIGCSACANNAVFDNGLCKCNYGYYGNGTSSCTQCPTGMTTNNLGAIDIASCVMKSNTKFCTVSQNRTLCLNFIPAGTQINYPGTSH